MDCTETISPKEYSDDSDMLNDMLVGFLIPDPFWPTMYRYWSDGKIIGPCYERFNRDWGCTEVWIRNESLANFSDSELFELFGYEYLELPAPFEKGNRKKYHKFPYIEDD